MDEAKVPSPSATTPKSPPASEAEESISVQEETTPVQSGRGIKKTNISPTPIHLPTSSPASTTVVFVTPSKDREDVKPSSGSVKKRRKSTSTSLSLSKAGSSPSTFNPATMTERQQMAYLLQMTDPQKKTEDSPTPIKETQVTPGRVHKRNERGETQLHVACIRGDINLATSLIEQGADINATDHAGWTPLHEACNHGYSELVSLLLSNGAGVNTHGMDGDTPLYDATINNHSKVVKLLMEHGSDPNLANEKEQTSLDVCPNEEIRQILTSTYAKTTGQQQTASVLEDTAPVVTTNQPGIIETEMMETHESKEDKGEQSEEDSAFLPDTIPLQSVHQITTTQSTISTTSTVPVTTPSRSRKRSKRGREEGGVRIFSDVSSSESDSELIVTARKIPRLIDRLPVSVKEESVRGEGESVGVDKGMEEGEKVESEKNEMTIETQVAGVKEEEEEEEEGSGVSEEVLQLKIEETEKAKKLTEAGKMEDEDDMLSTVDGSEITEGTKSHDHQLLTQQDISKGTDSSVAEHEAIESPDNLSPQSKEQKTELHPAETTCNLTEPSSTEKIDRDESVGQDKGREREATSSEGDIDPLSCKESHDDISEGPVLGETSSAAISDVMEGTVENKREDGEGGKKEGVECEKGGENEEEGVEGEQGSHYVRVDEREVGEKKVKGEERKVDEMGEGEEERVEEKMEIGEEGVEKGEWEAEENIEVGEEEGVGEEMEGERSSGERERERNIDVVEVKGSLVSKEEEVKDKTPTKLLMSIPFHHIKYKRGRGISPLRLVRTPSKDRETSMLVQHGKVETVSSHLVRGGSVVKSDSGVIVKTVEKLDTTPSRIMTEKHNIKHGGRKTVQVTKKTVGKEGRVGGGDVEGVGEGEGWGSGGVGSSSMDLGWEAVVTQGPSVIGKGSSQRDRGASVGSWDGGLIPGRLTEELSSCVSPSLSRGRVSDGDVDTDGQSGDDSDSSCGTVVSLSTSLPIIFSGLQHQQQQQQQQQIARPSPLASATVAGISTTSPTSNPPTSLPTITPPSASTAVSSGSSREMMSSSNQQLVGDRPPSLLVATPSDRITSGDSGTAKRATTVTSHIKDVASEMDDSTLLTPKFCSRTVLRSAVVQQRRECAGQTQSLSHIPSFLLSPRPPRHHLHQPTNPKVVYPPIHTAMYKLFTEQEADRVRLRSAHLTQQDRLLQCMEQELIRAHQRASRQCSSAISVCAVLLERLLPRAESIGNDTSLGGEHTGDINDGDQSAVDERMLASLVQDVWDKFCGQRTILLTRQRHEAEAMWMLQHQQWTERLKDLGFSHQINFPILHVPKLFC